MNFPFAQSEVYPIEDAINPTASTKHVFLNKGGKRMRVRQYLDRTDPEANEEARFMKFQAEGKAVTAASLDSNPNGSLITNR